MMGVKTINTNKKGIEFKTLNYWFRSHTVKLLNYSTEEAQKKTFPNSGAK